MKDSSRSARSLRLTLAVLGCAILYVSASPVARAQVYRVSPSPGAVGLKPLIVIGGTLTVTATPSMVTFNLVSKGTAAGSSGITLYTSWNVIGLDATLNVYGSFSSAASALTDGDAPPHSIPSAAVFGSVPTGVPTAYTAFTQTNPSGFGGANAGLELITATSSLPLSGNRTDTLNLEINLSTVPELPAGSYSGALTIQATMM